MSAPRLFCLGLMPGNQQQAFARAFPDYDITFDAGSGVTNKARCSLGQYAVVVFCCAWLRHSHQQQISDKSQPGTKLIFAHTRGVSGIVRDVRLVLEAAAPGGTVAATATSGHTRRAASRAA